MNYQKFFVCGWEEWNWTEEEMVFLTIGQRLTEVVIINDLTFGLPLSRLGIAQASWVPRTLSRLGIVQTNLTLPSLLHRLALLSLLHRLSMQTSVKRMIPLAESLSSVRFRSCHPSESVQICVICGHIKFMDNSWVIHVAPQANTNICGRENPAL